VTKGRKRAALPERRKKKPSVWRQRTGKGGERQLSLQLAKGNATFPYRGEKAGREEDFSLIGKERASFPFLDRGIIKC